MLWGLDSSPGGMGREGAPRSPQSRPPAAPSAAPGPSPDIPRPLGPLGRRARSRQEVEGVLGSKVRLDRGLA